MNVLLYFHRHKQGKLINIDRYWSGSVHNIKLREVINTTGKIVDLIAPTMGENPGSGATLTWVFSENREEETIS